VLLVGPLYMLHQCSLNFTKPGAKKTYKTVREFTLLMSGFSSLSLAIVGFTPIGPWLFSHLVGLTAQVGELAIGVIKVMAILPILVGVPVGNLHADRSFTVYRPGKDDQPAAVAL